MCSLHQSTYDVSDIYFNFYMPLLHVTDVTCGGGGCCLPRIVGEVRTVSRGWLYQKKT